jgi:hypothetical protein
MLCGPGREVACDVAAHAVLRVPLEAVGDIRRVPGPVWGPVLPPAFLKHADEQTVVGLGAVYHAIHDYHLSGPFTDWGVLAAPRFLGRPTMAAALQRFAAEGAWGVSPHLIPHRSLHAISGTVSQALKIQGPNFGVGGGPGAAGEALVAAAALLGRGKVPAIWVVLTGLDPEAAPDQAGRSPPGTHCVGMALALTTTKAGSHCIHLCVRGGDTAINGYHRDAAGFDLIRLQMLLQLLREPRSTPVTLVQTIDDGTGLCSRIELKREQGTGNREQQTRISAVPCSLSPVPSGVEGER